ncbi:MAG: type II toxin-antitoxin system Phd/YefM family antitoxin [Oculatellaceae cyanobacterium bins.114]|nr:type II toxin-antitoxin system Phd/YefM family antitoxin [Oculatellaceae cyanobacterium bins.114]
MLKVSIEDAAKDLRSLLERVSGGEAVILLEHNKEVARIIPPPTREQWLARRRTLRESLHSTGEALSVTILKSRQGERI